MDFYSLLRCHWRIIPYEGKKLASPLVVGGGGQEHEAGGVGQDKIGKARLACRYGDISAFALLSY